MFSVTGQAVVGTGSGAQLFAFLYDGTTNLGTGFQLGPNPTNTLTIPLGYRKVANSLSSITFSIYFGGNTGTSYLNSYNGSAAFGGTGNTFIKVQEIMGSIEPANDNGTFDRRMVG